MSGQDGALDGDRGGTMRSGEVARAAGVNQQTLRYYERRGLLAEPGRSPGGHRLYPAETVTVVRMIKGAQRLGFSLEEIDGLMAAGPRRTGPHRAGPHRARPNGAGSHGAGPNGAGPRGAGPRGAGLDRAGLHRAGLQECTAAKLAEVEARIAQLTAIAGTLRAALDAGCADLAECARHPGCPLPFETG